MVEAKQEPKHIVAQSIHPTGSRKYSNRQLWARIAYHYPQYTLQDASKLPTRDVKLLLKTAEEIRAEQFFNLTQISAAPHTKKGSGVKQLTDHFRKMMGN